MQKEVKSIKRCLKKEIHRGQKSVKNRTRGSRQERERKLIGEFERRLKIGKKKGEKF